MVITAVVSSAHLCGSDQDIAIVASVRAAAGLVSAIVLDVEVRAKPFVVLALCALNPLAPVRADADLQAKVGPGGAFGSFALTFLRLSFPAFAFWKAWVALIPLSEAGSQVSRLD